MVAQVPRGRRRARYPSFWLAGGWLVTYARQERHTERGVLPVRQQSIRLVAGLAWFFLTASLCAQRPGQSTPAISSMDPTNAGVAILVREPLGTPLSGLAIVRLYNPATSYNLTRSTLGGEAFFENIPVGNYVVEVSAPGYRVTTEEIEVLSAKPRVAIYITLVPERRTADATAGPAEPPVLTPKARKAIDQAVEALQKGDLDDALKNLDAARKLAPGHPDVPYLYGVLALKRNELGEAQAQLEKAVAILPRHGAALAALGEVFLRRGDTAKAISNLEQAVFYEPDTWQARGLLAAIFLRQNEPEKAQLHAERAVELTKGKIPVFRFLLAQVLARLKKMNAAEQQLKLLLDEDSNAPDAAEARRMLAEMKRRRAGPLSEASNKPASSSGTTPTAVSTLLPLPRTREDWAPREVDEVSPEVVADVSCPQADVLAGAARQVQALVNSLERITATERILYEELDKTGATTYWEDRTMNYVVSFLQPRPNVFAVEESRLPVKTGESNPRIATSGLVALALLFHPLYASDFETECAGLGQWRGRPVWILDFRQKPPTGLAAFRTYRTTEGYFRVRLKGRAWIDANAYHIMRLETDLLEPIPQARLARDHVVIEYGPVQFKKNESWLWLPTRAELYSLLRDRWYRVRHTLSDYMLFSIETRDKVAPPKEP